MNYFHKHHVTQRDGYNNLLLAIVERAVLDAQGQPGALITQDDIDDARAWLKMNCVDNVGEFFDSAKRVTTLRQRKQHANT
jgi:hypothetical protein